MADPVAGIPDALANRRKEVTLSDGSKVVVERWAWTKKMALVAAVVDPSRYYELAEASLQPSDRPKLATMEDEDVLSVVEAAIKLNVTKQLAKKAGALGETMKEIFEGKNGETP